MKRQILLPSLDLPRVKVGAPYNDILINIFFHLSSRSWEIGSPPIGGAGRLKLSLSCPHRSYSSDPFIHLDEGPPPQCELSVCILTVRHILVECNHFAGERDVAPW